MFPSGNYGRFSVTEDGSLFIQDVKDSDAGIYVCDAHNSKGKSSASSVLKVKGRFTLRHVSVISAYRIQ